MGRILRWAFHLAAAVSAVLFVGVCALWVRGDHPAYNLYWNGPRVGVTLGTMSGGFGLMACWTNKGFFVSPPGRSGFSVEAEPRIDLDSGEVLLPYMFSAAPHEWRGFFIFHSSEPDGTSCFMLAAPAWFLALLLLTPPALWAGAAYRRRRRARRAAASGLCPACGYDLRATPSRCPECGAVPSGNGRRWTRRGAASAG